LGVLEDNKGMVIPSVVLLVQLWGEALRKIWGCKIGAWKSARKSTTGDSEFRISGECAEL
jgi:hypothetical protein